MSLPPLFNGSFTSRRSINLGGNYGSSSSSSSFNSNSSSLIETGNQKEDLMKRAMREREAREQVRRREKAAIRIQSFYRGRHQATQERNRMRQEFDQLISQSPTSTRLIQATQRLVLFVVIQDTNNKDDTKRLATWSRTVLSPTTDSIGKTPALFSLYSSSQSKTWNVLVRQVVYLLLQRASAQPHLPQSPLFIEITKLVCDVASFTKWKVPLSSTEMMPLDYLIERTFYDLLRKLILAIPPTNTSHPALHAAITLSTLPFKAFPGPSASDSAKSRNNDSLSSSRTNVLTCFSKSVLKIPLLSNRVSAPSLTVLTAAPIEDVLAVMASPEFAVPINVDESVHLLANLVAFSSKRVSGFTSSKSFVHYLVVVRLLLDQFPPTLFSDYKKREEAAYADNRKGKGKEIDTVVIHDSDSESEDGDVATNEMVQRARARVGTRNAQTTPDAEGDVAMGEVAVSSSSTKIRPQLQLDSRTFESLSTLISREHLGTILTLSTRYSATSRAPLAAFLVSLLTVWPAKRDDVLNAIMYGGGQAASANERGGGLLRELYRGYVRSSSLGRILTSAGQDRRNAAEAITSSLANSSLDSDWTMLVLLSELYSRCLLTMGDDEFYSARNPLSLDEVVGLSSLLRNLVFQLYWQEGELMVAQEQARTIAGTKITIEALRTLATGLLQQIHARDSRKSFTPDDHWLMTSQFDLASFIATVVYEDEKLDAEEDQGGVAPGTAPIDSDDDEDETMGFLNSRSRINGRQGARAQQRRRTPASLTKRQMSFISPRLGVLNNIPFVIPFETRVAIFRQFVDNDRRRLGLELQRYDRSRRHQVKVRRTNLAADAFQQMSGLGAGIKSRIEIIFIDEHGMQESGIDGGGLFKELMTSLMKEAFDTDRGLWLATKQQELYPNPHSYAKEASQLAWYTFMGHILGKALYEGILVNVRFAGFFLAKWLGRQSYLDDLQSLDPELYSGLLQLKNYPGNVETDLSLNFTVTDDDFGASRTIDLVPNGSEIPVTNENRIRYIYLMSHYRLNVQLEKQCAAFFAGLSEIIPERFLRMFNQAELRVLVGGLDRPIDIEDLKRNTVYGGFEGEEANETIRSFWRIVETFDKEERANLVRFVTSCARPPLLGFKELVPKFALRNAGNDQNRLPTSSTCVNLLKISEYKDEETMREKLLYAINSGAGFDLS